MRRTLPPPLLFLPLVVLILVIFVFIKGPAKKQEPPKAAKTAPSYKIPKREASPPQKKEADRPQKPEAPRPKAAVIIDDLGYSLEAARTICALRQPVTVAILPFASSTLETAQVAHECGLEIMLHLPLESLLQKSGNSFGGMISAGMTREEIQRNILSCLEQIPWSSGVNNHEGSKITEDAEMMPEILEVLKDKGLYFIDSRTTRDSIAFETAKLMGVRAASRQVFLDGDLNETAIKAKIGELFRLAQARGRAVGICHPKKETLAALEKYLGLAADYGIKLVFASEIVE